MSAPVPYATGTLPVIFTGSYLTRQIGAGQLHVGAYGSVGTDPAKNDVIVGGSTVFDYLNSPPAGGLTAKEASLDVAMAVGSSLLTWTQAVSGVTGFYPTATGTQTNGHTFNTPNIIANLVKKNFDFVMNFFLENSIARNASGVPIP